MKNLRASVEQIGGESRIALAGIIDETGGPVLDEAFSELRPLVRINFERVERINSYGIGLMMRSFSRLARDHSIEFERCSEALVDQFQMLNFSAYGRITSLYVRFLCERCMRETSELLTVGADIKVESADNIVTPKRPCVCGGELVADDPLEFLADY